MNGLNWSYRKIPLTIKDIRDIESKLELTLPNEYKKILLSHHGARPDKKRFVTSTKTERVLKTFVPVTSDYEINLFSLIEWLNLPQGVIPFASTPSGDYICFRYEQNEDPVIVLYHHEIYSFEHVTNSFNQFLQSLY